MIRWKMARARGTSRFVLPFVLLVGGLPIVASLMSDYFQGRWPFAPDELWLEKLPYRVVGYLGFLLIGGAAGFGVYALMEWRYRKGMGGA